MSLPKEEGGLGFRDLKTFNLTLLAKQGWRLQTRTTSLVHRDFKARYFPNGNFLSAKMGHHPSYAWRSIMAAQNIVRHGHRWQVGNGQTIDIWHDKWLTTPFTFRFISWPQGVPDGAKVLVLIDLYTRSWQTNMIHQYFSPVDALAILSISISSRLPSDRMVWTYTTKGDFTVWSAYKLAMSKCNDGGRMVGQGRCQMLKAKDNFGGSFGCYKSWTKSNLLHGEQAETSYQPRLICAIGNR